MVERSARSAGASSGRLGVEAGKDVGAGGVGLADHVEVDAAEVAADSDVVLLVNPGKGVREGDGLVDLEGWLLLAEAGELVESDVGQAVEERIGGKSVEADLAGDVGGVGEVVARLGVRPVPVDVEAVGEVALAERVSGLQRSTGCSGCLPPRSGKRLRLSEAVWL